MRITLLIALLFALAAPAWAYTPHVGDRAADLTGWDMINQRSASLSEHSGKWIFIDFWASWCGPCMGEMPNFLDVTNPLRERDDFAVFTVSLDSEGSLPRLREAIVEYDLDYPILYDGGGWSSIPSSEWGVRSIPATYLVNPQGVIVAKNLRGESLQPALDFFLNYEGNYTPIGLRASHVLNDDGSVTVMLELCCPDHEPLGVSVDYWYTRYTWAEDDPDHENRPVDYEYIDPGEENPEVDLDVEFGMFADAVYSFDIPAMENTHVISYYVTVPIPGTEHLLDGAGLSISERGTIRLP